MTDTPPAANQLEVSVFGPGTGECIVVHVGDGDWIVVDSCIDRSSKRPIALDYLRSLDVDMGSQVKLVVSTHWHDDHIQGLAEVLRVSERAKFVNSAAYVFKELISIVQLGNKTVPQSSATKEYSLILDILEERKLKGERRLSIGPIAAVANKKILALDDAGRSISSEIFSLSPSDGVFNLAQRELQNAMTTIQERRRPVLQGPNQLSVVLWLRVGVLNVLLGGDLEHISGTTEGWRAITSSRERPAGRARYFKAPHHGSHNVDCPECWTELVSADPIVILTPYAASGLPKIQDLARFCAKTPSVYLTSDPRRYSLPRRENAVEKTLREVVVKRRAISGPMGHVRVRCKADDGLNAPEIDLRNGAQGQCA